MLTGPGAAGAQAPGSIEISLNPQLGQLYPLIQQHQASLKQDLNRFSPDNEPIDPETRSDDLCDILSSFDYEVTPGMFKQVFVDEQTSNLRPRDGSGLVLGSLAASMYHLACRDDDFYKSLQELVPADVRATQYHKTQWNRAQDALQMLSRYSRNGPTAQRAADRNSDMNVPACASQLRLIVKEICEDRDRRNETSPLSASVLLERAEILTKLIREVIVRDEDIYDNARWNRLRPQNERRRDRNLFSYLIGNPPSDPTLPPWMTDCFVVDRLRNLPPGEWSHLLEFFTTIKDAVEEKDMNIEPNAYTYVARIDTMVREYTAGADEPSSSSVQVPRHA